MTKYRYNKRKKDRRSIRLENYDYTQPGMYFVTVCAKNKRNPFGGINNLIIKPNRIGKIVKECWVATTEHFPYAGLDEWTLMPNHIHGIIEIKECRGKACLAPTPAFGKPPAHALSSIAGSFKSAASKKVNQVQKRTGVSIWQRNYYEHVIRDEEDLFRIREYIINNPEQWELDRENPNAKGSSQLEDDIFGIKE
jgi:REP element-mobilizing transposase RayT